MGVSRVLLLITCGVHTYNYINWHDKLRVKKKSGRPSRTQKKGKEKKIPSPH